jgi:hypothetical protein
MHGFDCSEYNNVRVPGGKALKNQTGTMERDKILREGPNSLSPIVDGKRQSLRGLPISTNVANGGCYANGLV